MDPDLKIIVLVGAPGSGKSTFANELLRNNSKLQHLSSDQFRLLLTNDENNQDENTKVFYFLKHNMLISLLNKESVIIDATNISIRERRNYINVAKTLNIKVIAHVFECDRNFLIERNTKRGESGGRNVSESVIDKMLSKYERPSTEEGFDEIHFH